MSPEQSAIITSAPAKVILFGEHSVVYGGTAIAASINKRTRVKLVPKSSKQLCFRFENINLDVSLDPDNPTVPENLNFHQKQALECGLAIYDKVKPLNFGFDVTVTSDFPIGAGLGSSASLSVSLSAAVLAQKFRETGKPVKKNLLEFSDQFSEDVLSLSNLCEKIFHGNPSGIDSSTSFLGGIIKFDKQQLAKKIADSISMKLLIVDSKVERQTSEIVARLAVLRTRFPKPVHSIFDSIDQIAKAAIDCIGLEEEGLVDLFRMNHGLLSGMGLSHPALEKIKESVSDLLVGFKLTGAGCGGNGIVVVPNSVSIDEVCARIREAGFEPNLVTLGVEGLQVTMD